MMRRTLPPVLFLIWLCMGSAHGQDKPDPPTSVQGKVNIVLKDRKGSGPLRGAHVMLINDIGENRDTLYTTTDIDGLFHFVKLRPRPTFIRVSSVGYETQEGVYELDPGQNLCYFQLKEIQEELGPAKVTAEAPLMRRIGDTTVYNAGVVQTMDGESLRGLLEKLPGFQITESGIKVDGEEVKRTYVNGILLFGDGVTTATDALYASEVSQVKVYDEQTPEGKVRGLQNSRQRVLDIVTKDAMMSFSQASLSASGGFDDTGQARYTAYGGAAFYSELMSFNLQGLLDNNDSGIILAISHIPDGSGWGRNGQLSSYKEDAKTSVNFQKFWGSRDFGSNLNAHYNFAHDYGREGSVQQRDHYTEDGMVERSSRDTSSAASHSGKHSVILDFTWKKNPGKSLYGQIYGNFEAGSSHKRNLSVVQSGESVLTRDEYGRAERKGYNLVGVMRWTDYSFSRFKYSTSLRLSGNRMVNPSERRDTLTESAVRMRLLSDGIGKETNVQLSAYAEWVPVNDAARTWQFSGAVDIDNIRDVNTQTSRDVLSGMPVPYLSETFDYTFDLLLPVVNLGTQYTSRAIEISAEVKARWAALFLDERYPSEGKAERLFPAVLPSFRLKWKGFQARVETRQTLPAASQIRKRISDADPLFLTGGNPSLRPSYDANATLSWNKSWGPTSVNASLQQNLSWNTIVSRAMYFTENTVLADWDGYEAVAGSMLYTYDNAVTPHSLSSAKFGLTRLMARRKLSAGINLGGSMLRNPMYLGLEYVSLRERQLSSSLSLRLTPDKHWKFSLAPELKWEHSTGGAGTLLSERLCYGLKAYATAKYDAIEGDINYAFSYIDRLSGLGADVSRHILNLSVGRSFFKKQWKVELVGLDLLNAGSVYSMILTPEAMTQTWTPTYGRRLMLTLSYRFRNAKS